MNNSKRSMMPVGHHSDSDFTLLPLPKPAITWFGCIFARLSGKCLLGCWTIGKCAEESGKVSAFRFCGSDFACSVCLAFFDGRPNPYRLHPAGTRCLLCLAVGCTPMCLLDTILLLPLGSDTPVYLPKHFSDEIMCESVLMFLNDSTNS